MDQKVKEWLKQHGLTVRGQKFRGIVVSMKMKDTAVVEWGREVKVPKYERAYRAKSRVKAHVPPVLSVKPGDLVVIGETRKIAKTKSFVVLEVLKGGKEG